MRAYLGEERACIYYHGGKITFIRHGGALSNYQCQEGYQPTAALAAEM